MTTVEKRRSGRKSGGHRKQSDGGYSDTSSAGSFPDENDREVSNLTDRAFRSLCIGDEAVYNDSDLGLSSPCTGRDKQLAFSQHGQDREREELKRTAHENFSLRVQQYEEDWIRGGGYGSEIHRDPQWEVYGERTHGGVSATFQHSFVETSQQERSLREEQLSILSNGATELNSQQLRSRSRVSSLIRAFNSEGQRDMVGMDDRFREWSDETSWDKSALMSIQRELSEFSSSYQQNFNSGHLQSAGPFLPQDNNFYSPEAAAVAHMSHNSAASFMRSSHSKHSMSAQVNCNSNFFIHSEFSPFRVWRDHNRFPFQHGQVSGFMHCSEFPKWYETPMYKELSLQDQPYRGVRQSHLAPVVPPTPPRSTSTSMVIQKASAMEKRCESELAGHYPHRKRTQSLGPNRLPSQRPSTASPTTEMSRRVRDTISSVKALQQKIKRMAKENSGATGVINNQGGYYCNNNVYPCESNAATVESNVVRGNTSTTPFNISQLLSPSANSHQEAQTSDFQHYDLSAPPVEHPPVRAESRGATPDVRMSSYKSRATSLLFNLKDNRKRVKSTYSPTKFKGLETQEKNKQPSALEPRETVIDIPDFSEPYNHFLQSGEPNRTNAATHQYANQYDNPFLNPQTAATHTTQYPGYTVSDDQTTQMQGQMAHHSGFTGFIPENYTSNQLTNGQNLNEDSVSFVPYKQGVTNTIGTLEDDVYRLQQSSSKQNTEQNYTREYLQNNTNYERPSNETLGKVFTKVDRYEQLKDSKHGYNNASSQDMHRQTYSQDTEKLSLKEQLHPLKQDSGVVMEKTRQETQPILKKETELRESFGADAASHLDISKQPQQCALSKDTGENLAWHAEMQSLAFQDKKGFQKYSGHFENSYEEGNWKTHNDNRYPDQESRNQVFNFTENKLMDMQGKGCSKPDEQLSKCSETQILQPQATNPSFEPTIQRDPDNTAELAMPNKFKDGQFIGIKAEKTTVEDIKAEHQQAKLAKVQVELPTVESTGHQSADQEHSENIGAEESKSESTQPEMVKQAEAENTEEKKIEQQTEESSEKEDTVPKPLDESRNIANEFKHMREEQSQQAKAEPAENEKQVLNEMQKTDLDAQARLKQTHLQHATITNTNGDKFRKEQSSKVQVKTEQTEADQIRTENTEQAGTASRKAEQALTDEMKKQQFKAEQEKTTIAKLEKINTDHFERKEARQATDHKDLVHVGLVNVEQQRKWVSSTKERKAEDKSAEQAKTERIKMDTLRLELSKVQNMQERSAKLTARLTATQPAKSEPDKVEQVKTELAKAKAELAKIKEKMKGEHKEKVKNTTVIKEYGSTKSNATPQLNTDKNEEYKKEKQEAQMHAQREVPAARNSSHEPDRGADEYNRLREKYGFIDAVSPNKKKVLAQETVSSFDKNETQVSSPEKADTVNKEKSTHVVTTADNIENKEVASNFDSPEVTESQYVYSETSKEFKLSSANDSETKRSKEDHGNSVTDKLTDDSVNKLGKSDPVKDTNVSLHKDSVSTKLLPPKTKPNDHTFIPPKALPHKERAQTKQEILTSKIKAHAEKEISAIKEKGFAMRDGSKSFGKLLPSGQSVNIRQKPPSQDTHKKNETMGSSSVTMKQQTDSARVQPVPNISPHCSTTTTAKSSATAPQPEDTLLKQIPEKSTKADVPEKPRETKQAECPVNFSNGSVQNENQETPSEIASLVKTNEEAAKSEQGKPQIKHEDISGKKKEEQEEILVVKTDIHTKKKEYPPDAKQVAPENVPAQEAPHEDSEPSINLFFGQKEDPIADDSLQIMGIMVTVRDRNPSLDTGHNSTLKLMSATAKESSNEVLDERHAHTHLYEREKTTASEDAVTGKMKDRQQNHSAAKDDQTKVGLENEHKTLISETRKVTEDNTEGCSTNVQPQSETKPEPMAVKGVTVTALSKNKVLDETQPLLHKQNIVARETNHSTVNKSTKAEVKTEGGNPYEIQTPQTNNNQIHKEVNSAINKGNATTQLQHGVQPSATEGKTAAINQSKNSNSEDENGLLLEDKRQDPIRPSITFNKTSPSSNLTGNENNADFPKHEHNEKHIGENNEEDDIHIDSIAIKVIPAAATKDKVNQSKTSQSDFVLSNERTETATSSCKENTSNNEDTSKSISPACSEKKVKDNLDDKLGMQHQHSSSSSGSNKAACENIQPENAKQDSVKTVQDFQDELNKQLAEGDYFQIQRVTETSNESQSAAARNTVKEKELPSMLLNETSSNKESCKEDKNDVFVFKLDKDTVESGSKSFHEESVKRKNGEREDPLFSPQTDGSKGRPSNNEKTEPGQANQTRKHHTEHESSSSVMERHSSRRLHPKRDNQVKENPEVKPKPKERVSTIPEISALADYARLKVIVSEDKDVNPVQEFPPNKKEGFFPLIHTRHSRRPVFTAEPQHYSMKEKTLPSNTEMTAKVNKEPKALAFPITEKEHQRTGMFKLGDKERQDKMLSEGKVNENVISNATKNVQSNSKDDLMAGQIEQTARVGTQRVNEIDLNSFQQRNHPLQATTSSESTSEGLTYFDNMAPPLATIGQIHNKKENITPRNKEERIITQLNKDEESETENKRKDRAKIEVPAIQNEQVKAKQQDKIKQPDEESSSRSKDDNREEEIKIKHMIEESRASQAEEERTALQREEERRAREREAIAIKIKERREKQREIERKTEEERQAKQREAQRAQKEEEIRSRQRKDDIRTKETEEKMRKSEEGRRATQEELYMRTGQAEKHGRGIKEEQEEQQRRAAQEEQQRRAAQEEQQRAAQEEQQKRAAQEEQQKRVAQEEQQRRAAQEEQQKRVAQEEQQRRAAQEEQQRRAAQEEQQRAAQEEQQRRAAQEEQQKRVAQVEQQRRGAQEQQRKAEQEQQQRRAAQEERKRRELQEQNIRRIIQEERQRRAEQEEQHRRAAKEEQQKRAAQEEQQRKEQERRAAQQEQQRNVAQAEQQRKAAQEQERGATQEKQQRTAEKEKQQRIDAEQQQMRTAQEKQQGQVGEHQKRVPQEKERRATLEEQQRRVAHEVQKVHAAQEEQQRRAKLIITDNEEERRERHREQNNAAYISKEQFMKQISENKAEQQIEDQMQETEKKELTKIQKHEQDNNNIRKQREASQTKEQRALLLEKSQAEVSQDTVQEKHEEFQIMKKEEKNLATHKEKTKAAQIEKQRQVAQMDALQYYAITSAEPERKHKERQLCSPLPSQQRNTPGLESTDWPYRPHAPVSPATSLPRSTTSSPALGGKPLMFRVKDNTMRGSSFTKSVKPRFHKNFGEDFWGGSPTDRGLEKGEDQEIMRRRTGTPVHLDSGSNRLMAINESSISRSVSSLDGYSTPVSYHRPYSRRSIVMDDDDSRSVFSTTSEGVESFATSATDLADIRGLYDYDRPESACSFSSDVSRSLGKPPTVPPKSEKALRRAQRLTTRRMKKELSKVAETDTVGPHKEGPIICSSSSSTEVRPSNCHAVASPHFSPPVSLAHARTVGSSLPSSHAEQQTPHRSFHAFPHATGPISLPNSSAHANPAVTLPAAPKTVTHVPSSPTLHHVNHPAPVTQYQVESSYPQSYPLTQRKVLQDLGSGQYFVVDVPVEVKTKTFIDPETGKYVQLNVRESGQGLARHQPQLQPQRPIKQQQLPLSQVSPSGKPAVLYQGYHGYPHNYQPAAIKSLQSDSSSAPAAGQPDQQPTDENQSCRYPAPEAGQNTEGHRYSPEKTPYMDTVNDTDKRHSGVYSAHGSYESFPECDTNSQLAGRSVCENDNSAPSQYQPREIITMSELEDFMELSDW